MLIIRRRLLWRWGRSVSVAAMSAAVAFTMFANPAAADPSYVKYYVVLASYQGAAENLREISERFLGTPKRSDEIFDLSRDLVQPDSGKLADPAVLHAGWLLVLPWDATGSGVQYGLLPTPRAPAPSVPPTTPTGSQPTASGPGSGPSATVAAAAPGAGCAGTQPTLGGDQSGWAMLRLAPEQAWTYTRGSGVVVAVVDSGVDATLPELAGHVTAGADIVDGTGRGDVDCRGTGTAMAGIIAGRSGDKGDGLGIAPDATVMPVRVSPAKGAASVSDQATGIEVAVSAGAKVIALGSYIDTSQPAVGAAIQLAASRDVVVVAGAPLATGAPATPPASSTSGFIRVGAIGIDGAIASGYQRGGVEVVAPGIDVASLGISGVGRQQSTGTQYATAFVAGQAALVRAMYPQLTASAVARRIEATADRMGVSAPDPAFGWGFIDPGESVVHVIADEGRTPDPAQTRVAGSWSSRRTLALAIALSLAVLLFVVLWLRVRRLVRVRESAPESSGHTSSSQPGGQQPPEPTLPDALAADSARLRTVGPAGHGPSLTTPVADESATWHMRP